jgi:putative cell wall-binding protein
MTKLSKMQFAAQWDISRPTLNKRIGAGEISVELDEKGRTLIDVAEAIRLGIPARGDKASQQSSDPIHDAELRGVKRELEITQQWLEDKQAALQRMEEDLTYWRDLGKQTLQITDERDIAQKEAAATEEKMKAQFGVLADQFEVRAAKADEARSALEAELDAKRIEADAYAKAAAASREEEAKALEKIARVAKEKAELEADLFALRHRGFWSRLFGGK